METDYKGVMDTIHVWIGFSLKKLEEFEQYFAINSIDRDAGTGASQFDKDININWYDDDLIGVYFNEHSNDLEATLDELPVASETVERQIRSRCAELNIIKANALFYYTDSSIVIPYTDKKYNGLTYLGAFDNS